MSKAHPPELKKYMEKRLAWTTETVTHVKPLLNKAELEKAWKGVYGIVKVKLNGGRRINGILRGFDPFMNLVIDETVEETKTGEKHAIGMVVVRGNSIIILEALDRV